MPQHTVPLSILDQKMPLWHTSTFLAFSKDGPGQTFQALRHGLNSTTRQLPFLSGVVIENAQNHDRSEVVWNDEPNATDIEWEKVPWPADTRPIPTYADLVCQYMPLHEYFNSLRPPSILNIAPGKGAPVFVLSYTEVIGGLLVFFGVHHHIMDEGGREILLRLWANNTKNKARDLHRSNGISVSNPFAHLSGSATEIEPPSAIPRDEPRHRIERFKQIMSAGRHTQSTPLARTAASSGADTKGDLLSIPRPGPPSPLTAKIFRLSVARISALRKVLRAHTSQDISLNVLVSSLVWALISRTRYCRLKQNNIYGLGPDELISQLLMPANLRSRFREQKIIIKDAWLGNLNLPLTPMPCLPFKDFSHMDQLELGINFDDQKRSICVPAFLPRLIDSLNSYIASLSVSRAAEMMDALEPTGVIDGTSYTYCSLRSPNIALLNGLNVVLTAWSNFDYYPDFGSEVGRPEFVRPSAGPPIADGLVVFLPRKRAGHGWTAKDVDTFEVLAKLREEDMKVFEADEALRELSLGD